MSKNGLHTACSQLTTDAEIERERERERERDAIRKSGCCGRWREREISKRNVQRQKVVSRSHANITIPVI